MSTLTRRDVLKSTAAVPLAAWLDAARDVEARQVAAPSTSSARCLSRCSRRSCRGRTGSRSPAPSALKASRCRPSRDQAEAEAIAKASESTGLVIHSVMNSDHWRYPLSSPDPEVVRKSVAGMKTSLMNAALWKAGIVLLVPAVVDGKTGYSEAWSRSVPVIRDQLIPIASGFRVQIGIEEVWNKFLLSPLEFNRYIDEFQSPIVKAYFDVGNVVFYGYPQDWIRTLGRRIARLHLKDFKVDRDAGTFEWKNLGEGDIDWVEVRKALVEAPNAMWLTTEISGGDRAYLTDVLRRVDRFLAGFRPTDA